jgi:hypothetical protein
MLLNPHRSSHLLQAVPGTRILIESFGLIGVTFQDLKDRTRSWTITSVLAPIPGRALGGVRVRAVDTKGFASFCNQRDLELILGLAEPGMTCPWLRERYPEFDERDFYGMCADEEDLLDDLYEHEQRFRQTTPDVLEFGSQFTRLLHIEEGHDVEELMMMLYDCDPVTGYGPDPRFETLTSRWTRVERSKVEWSLHGM